MEPRTALPRLAASVLMLVVALACAPAPAAPRAQPAGGAGPAPAQTEGLQALIDGARQEGQLSLVWGAGTMGGREGVARLAEGFNRAYGLNVDIQYTIGLSFPEMAAKVIQEYQAGRRATTDILLGSDNSINAAVRAEALERVDWATWAPNIRNPALIAGQGEGVTFQTWLPGVTYNSSRVSGDEVPRTMQDLLKPQYKGRIASTPYAANLDRLAAADLWGKQRTLDYARALATQLAGLIRCNETERVVNGEFDIFALDCNQANTLGAKARGAPVEFTLVSDVPIVSTIYLTVPKNAAHPNAAKLWINYVLGREVQDLLYQMDYMDSHLVEGSQTAKDIQKLEASGARFTVVGLEWYQAHDENELNAVREEIQRILRNQ